MSFDHSRKILPQLLLLLDHVSPVSYTHLDVYKRQDLGYSAGNGTITVTSGDKVTDIAVTEDMKVSEFVNEMCIRDSRSYLQGPDATGIQR